MKYWSAGDIDSDVYDFFFNTRKIVEKKINEIILNKDYGSDISSLDVIFSINKNRGSDKINFKSKSKELDLIVSIDYELFKNNNSIQREKLLIKNLVKVLEELLWNKKIKDFKVLELCSDLTHLTKNNE